MVLKGNAVSEGVALGKIFVYEPFYAAICENFRAAEDVPAETARYQACKAAAVEELRRLREGLRPEDADKAKIFVAHEDILNDVVMEEEILEAIRSLNWSGDWAVSQVYGKYARMLREVPDPLIRERATDLMDVRGRLLRIWAGGGRSGLSRLDGPVIVAARDLFPSDTATLDRENVLAIVTETGGYTSHSAIIARAYGLPAVLGVPGLLRAVRHGREAAVDAFSGEIVMDPEPAVRERFLTREKEWLAGLERTGAFLRREGRTADGERIAVGLNMAFPEDGGREAEECCDFVGLFRTEFLYMGRPAPPSEEEQFAAYSRALARFAPRPVTLRTLDIGGDKQAEYLGMPREENPALGNRALRLCFTRPELFHTQLRAALRASVSGSLHLMLPMVGGIDDIRRAKAFIAEAGAELAREGHAVAENVKVGIMVEIPAIALIADLAAKETDFASIGTNDLCQFALAADRMNPDTAQYCQAYHPAVFRLIGAVAEAYARERKFLSVCGEMGGDRLAAPVLVGLGLRKLSMNFSSMAGVKRVLSGLTLARAEALGETVRGLPTAAEVRAYLQQELRDIAN